MLDRIALLHERLLVAFTWVSGLCLLAVSVVTSADVTIRWATGRPLSGILEVNEIGFVLITFAAMGLMLFRGRQMCVDIFTARFSGWRRRVAKIFDCLFGLIFFGILFWSALHEFTRAYAGHYTRQGILQIPEAIPLAFVVIGTALSILTLFLQLVMNIAGHSQPSHSA